MLKIDSNATNTQIRLTMPPSQTAKVSPIFSPKSKWTRGNTWTWYKAFMTPLWKVWAEYRPCIASRHNTNDQHHDKQTHAKHLNLIGKLPRIGTELHIKSMFFLFFLFLSLTLCAFIIGIQSHAQFRDIHRILWIRNLCLMDTRDLLTEFKEFKEKEMK